MWPAFLAGSVAPDLGFFPGAPRRFSERLHHEYTGDFLRALRDETRDEVEWAFVAGWALHLYTDVALHPWVNARIDAFLQRLSGRFASRRNLWHMRLEHGIDCNLLEREDLHFLWDVNIHYPPRRPDGPGLLGAVGKLFYGEEAQEVQISKGIDSQKKWIGRLPWIFQLTGNTRPTRKKGLVSMVGYCTRPLVGKLLGDWLGSVERWDTMAAVARPLPPDPVLLNQADHLGEQALEAFRSGFDDHFATLDNLDLDTGEKVS